MYYPNMVPGRFLARPNRFIAHIEFPEGVEVCHVKNTGRCRELLTVGAPVWCQRSANPARKTKYDLIAVEKNGLLINMDSQAPNIAAGEWLAAGGLGPLTDLKPEQRFENSRFDFAFTRQGQPCFLEVKGVTLEDGGRCAFPDAPTERGAKHIHELIRAKGQGYGAYLLFVIQMAGAKSIRPNDATDPAFGAALREAHAAGVKILAYDCRVTPETMELAEKVPVCL